MIYYSLCQHFYWPSVSVNAYKVVKIFTYCARKRMDFREYLPDLKLFLATKTLVHVSVNILETFSESNICSTALFMKGDCFSRWTETVPLLTSSANDIPDTFTKQWLLMYGPPGKLLFDNRNQSVVRLFTTRFCILGNWNIYCTTYHSQRDRHDERLNRALLVALRHRGAIHSYT